VQQFCTLGSVRGRSLSVTVNLNGHAAGNGRYSQGDTYDPTEASPTRRTVRILGFGAGTRKVVSLAESFGADRRLAGSEAYRAGFHSQVT